jgi:hypothetical protein
VKNIEQFQIKKIYAIGNALGITVSGSNEDELHALVCGITGKDSVKKLTYMEAGKVIARLEELQGKSVSPTVKRNSKEYREKPGGVTAGQQRKIWALMYEIKKHDAVSNDVPLGDRLCKIIKKELGIDAMAKEPFVWMDFSQGNKLIEILKKYAESAERKIRGVENGIDGG